MRWLTIGTVLALGIILAEGANAECKDDIAVLQRKVATQDALTGKQTFSNDPASAARGRVAAAKLWIAKAVSAQPTSELECLNDLSRARKALMASSQTSP